MTNAPATDVCPLCARPLEHPMSKHHLVPISKGGKHTPTITLHHICHKKIHKVFKETALKRTYNTIEQIKENEEIQKFIKWVQKKEPGYYD